VEAPAALRADEVEALDVDKPNDPEAEVDGTEIEAGAGGEGEGVTVFPFWVPTSPVAPAAKGV
jgi:hypothetical protein